MTDVSERRAIRVSYELTAPPEKVWRALTDPTLLERWLMPNDIAPIVGHRFTFRTHPAPGFDGIVHCEIIEVDPPMRLVYSWRGGPIDTVVTWSLEKQPDGGTRLLLVQDGFRPEDGLTYQLLEKGWREKTAGSLEKLASSL
jgi:uncharacterized protein YndB with AHSA1/START domain